MLSLLLVTLLAAAPQSGDLVAIRVRRAETVAQGPIEHALILVEGGKIIEIGEDLPVERGIRVLDRPDWIATPGLVNAHTRAGAERSSGRGFEPQVRPTSEIDPRADYWRELLELGVTTLGFYPDGGGIPGQAIVLQPYGKSVQEMLVAEPAYLKVFLQSSAASKKALREAFLKADEYMEKLAKEREKWEKEQEKKKKSSKSSASSKKEDEKKDDPKADEKSKDEKKEPEKGTLAPEQSEPAAAQDEKKDEPKKDADTFVPPVPDEKVKPFLDLRQKTLTAMMSIRKAADYLHLLDVIEKEKDVQWFLQFPLQDDGDLYEVASKIGERKLLVVTEPEITLQTNSLRERNIPAELVRAGAKLALTPRFDSPAAFKDWLPDVGRLIGQGLPREAALAAVTLEGARALGLEKSLGSLEKDKTANIVFWSGDPFEPSSRVAAVMLAGKFVVGEVK
ncbi:MAG: amidohydrolase family protein [Planctomycetes bacterium]|nr:amidohydrolase family protein [Planctomycetota bacterium]